MDDYVDQTILINENNALTQFLITSMIDIIESSINLYFPISRNDITLIKKKIHYQHGVNYTFLIIILNGDLGPFQGTNAPLAYRYIGSDKDFVFNFSKIKKDLELNLNDLNPFSFNLKDYTIHFEEPLYQYNTNIAFDKQMYNTLSDPNQHLNIPLAPNQSLIDVLADEVILNKVLLVNILFTMSY